MKEIFYYSIFIFLKATKSPVLSSVVQVRAKDETAVKNNLAEPEYDFLSKQPAEIVDETYKVIFKLFN